MDYEPTKETIDAVIDAMVDSNWVHDRDEAEPEVRLFIKAAAPFIRAQATQAELREAFDAGCSQGGDEATAYEWGSRPNQLREEAFQEYLRDYERRALIPAETKETQ